MARYSKCKFKESCKECPDLKEKWGVMVCSQYNTVVGTEDLKKKVLDRVNEMTRMQEENASLLSDLSHAKESKLLKEDIALCELWKKYNSLRLDLKMLLDGCEFTDFDREQLYKYFDVSEKIKEVMK